MRTHSLAVVLQVQSCFGKVSTLASLGEALRFGWVYYVGGNRLATFFAFELLVARD